MIPDFNKNAIETLAKRSAFKCSNPDCSIYTVGPNSNPQKATLIGEAAHIFGARPKAKRYVESMTDSARADITNGIWLCRNCHKKIDTDDPIYSAELMFAWREKHENKVLSELGNTSDKIKFEQEYAKMSIFENYPPLIRRIALDKPVGWEFRLTSELMKHLNRPLFRRLNDLKEQLYVRTYTHLEDDDVIDWINKRITEVSNLINPFVNLLNKLSISWGELGKEGDIEEILHITSLIREHLEEVVAFEEKIYFTQTPSSFQKLACLLKDCMGSQAKKLENLPGRLDEISAIAVENVENGKTIEIKDTIEFKLPDGWEKQFNKELKKAERDLTKKEKGTDIGCGTTLLIMFFVYMVISSFMT